MEDWPSSEAGAKEHYLLGAKTQEDRSGARLGLCDLAGTTSLDEGQLATGFLTVVLYDMHRALLLGLLYPPL